jgi:hypothetical protein
MLKIQLVLNNCEKGGVSPTPTFQNGEYVPLSILSSWLLLCLLAFCYIIMLKLINYYIWITSIVALSRPRRPLIASEKKSTLKTSFIFGCFYISCVFPLFNMLSKSIESWHMSVSWLQLEIADLALNSNHLLKLVYNKWYIEAKDLS